MMKKVFAIAALLATSFAVMAEDAVSSNTYGFLKIVSSATNTIISIPWKGYTEDDQPTLDLLADHLVKPKNIDVGDELLLLGPDNKTYASWLMTKTKDANGRVVGTWQGALTVTPRAWIDGGRTYSNDTYVYDGTDTAVTKRGYGLWLIRHNPLDASGNPKPFYVHGQWTKVAQEVTVAGTNALPTVAGPYDMAAYTMLANPDCTKDTKINDMSWPDAGPNDTLIVTTDSKMTLFCFKLKKNPRRGGGVTDHWYYNTSAPQTVDYNATATSEYSDDITVPKGTGFWYVRRTGADFTFTWPAPASTGNE